MQVRGHIGVVGFEHFFQINNGYRVGNLWGLLGNFVGFFLSSEFAQEVGLIGKNPCQKYGFFQLLLF